MTDYFDLFKDVDYPDGGDPKVRPRSPNVRLMYA